MIRKIQERLPGEEALLYADELLQVWMVHHLRVIGEAARGISPASGAAHPEVEWTKIVAMRNILVQEYFDWTCARCGLRRQSHLRADNDSAGFRTTPASALRCG